jgi:YfiR/HmsC-like
MKGIFLARTLICIAFLFSHCVIADDANLEYKIKAGYLYNFTKFITWPVINGATFNLCLLGDDPFASDIDAIEKKSAFEHPIEVLRLRETDFLSGSSMKTDCHILYVSASIDPTIVFAKIQASPDKAKILVVGEGENFAPKGGMIGFVNRNGKIKLQINLHSVKQTGLKISAKLLEIAELIKEDKP